MVVDVWIASAFLYLCESVFTISVTGRVIEGRRMPYGYTSRNGSTSFNVQSICSVAIIKSLRKQRAVDLYAHSYHIRGTADKL